MRKALLRDWLKALVIGAVLGLMLAYAYLADDAQALSATWYGPGFYGSPTTSGEIYTGQDLTAAHPTAPFGMVMDVTGPNGKTVPVRINDRCSCELDLSEGAASATGVKEAGRAEVTATVSDSSKVNEGASKPSDGLTALPDTGGVKL